MTDTEPPHGQDLHRWMGIIGLFIAPATVITSLCYFFGYVYIDSYMDYFGIDSSAIGFSNSDYVTRSVSALFLPVVLLSLGWVGALWTSTVLRVWAFSDRYQHLHQDFGWTAVVIGLAGIGIALVGMIRPQYRSWDGELLTPIALGTGSAVIVAGMWLVTRRRVHSPTSRSSPGALSTARRGTAVAGAGVILISLFWLTDVYAVGKGREAGAQREKELWDQDDVVILDTVEPIGAPSSQVVLTRLQEIGQAAEAKPWLRYECFRSLVVRGDRWVLVPARWTPQYGNAVFVTADQTHRIWVKRIAGIANTKAAADKSASWKCPEVAPTSQLYPAP